jgi:uncharacterized protein
MKLLYLHGFCSSPRSDKAVSVVNYCAQHGLPEPIVPQLPVSPIEAIQLCEQLIEHHPINAVCGSSLGGFYALYLAEKFKLRCALINPAITPWQDMERTDNQARYAIDSLEDANHALVEQLKLYYVQQLSQPHNTLLLVGTADQVLDAQQSIGHLAQARHIIVEGGDHNLTDFGGHLEDVVGFLRD